MKPIAVNQNQDVPTLYVSDIAMKIFEEGGYDQVELTGSVFADWYEETVTKYDTGRRSLDFFQWMHEYAESQQGYRGTDKFFNLGPMPVIREGLARGLSFTEIAAVMMFDGAFPWDRIQSSLAGAPHLKRHIPDVAGVQAIQDFAESCGDVVRMQILFVRFHWLAGRGGRSTTVCYRWMNLFGVLVRNRRGVIGFSSTTNDPRLRGNLGRMAV